LDANLFGHAANVLFGLAYLVKDILWLRLISLVACLIMIFFYYFSPEQPLWVAIYWNAIFISVNGIRSIMLLMERNQARFWDADLDMYTTLFRHMSPIEFSKVLKTGHWKYFRPESVILNEGEKPDALILLYSGTATVQRSNDNRSVELQGGTFIGEMSMLTDGPASASVYAGSEIRAFCWPRKNLDALFKKNPHLKASFLMVIASDMAHKLRFER
jgi:hypothetical protein